jgi:hypothetical protein
MGERAGPSLPSPYLADKIARSIGQYTIEEIALKIADVVRPTVDTLL